MPGGGHIENPVRMGDVTTVSHLSFTLCQTHLHTFNPCLEACQGYASKGDGGGALHPYQEVY